MDFFSTRKKNRIDLDRGKFFVVQMPGLCILLVDSRIVEESWAWATDQEGVKEK